MKIAIIIPCFNEAENIENFINSLHLLKSDQNLDLTVIAVNDCSTDHTGKILEKLPCITLVLPINLGIGGAVQTGFRYAFLNGYQLAVQMDGDGQHPARELPKMIQAFHRENADVVIGSRFLTGEGFQSTAIRRVGIVYFTRLIHLLTGRWISDPTSGFRVLNRRAMAVVNKYYPNEFPEPEILIYYLSRKLKVIETPVRMQGRTGGTSSIRHWKSVYYMLKVSAGILFSHIRLKYYAKA